MIYSVLEKMGGVRLVEDTLRFKEHTKSSFFKLFVVYPEYRYLFFYRLRMHSKFMNIILAPLKLHNNLNLYLRCKDIGGGLFIEHGYATGIACRHIGKNCWINQKVTVGFSDATHCPYIGDNVSIKVGANVIGGITIGNDVIIGANSLVLKDVPDHSIVAGVPARVIKTRKSTEEPWKRVKIE